MSFARRNLNLHIMDTTTTPKWMHVTLVAAGSYNLLWGAAVVLFPTTIFRWTGMELPRYPQIWQCVGMIVGVYGVGYLVAAREPFRHWPIVLVGLLGKVFGPIGFLSAAASGDLPWAWGVTILGNDLIWWLPFTAILYGAFRAGTGTASNSGSLDHQTSVVTSGGELRCWN